MTVHDFAAQADLTKPFWKVIMDYGDWGGDLTYRGFGAVLPKIEGGRIPYDADGLPMTSVANFDIATLYHLWATTPAPHEPLTPGQPLPATWRCPICLKKCGSERGVVMHMFDKHRKEKHHERIAAWIASPIPTGLSL